jgi:hypothetical protein
LPQRGSRPHWIICGLEEPDKPATPRPMVGGRQRQNGESSAQCGMTRRRCYLPSEARPRPSGVGPGSPRPVASAKSSFQFLALQRLRAKFWPKVGNRTDRRPLKHIWFQRGLGECVCHPLLNGRCVSPANTGWDWPEFRPANAALRSGLSNAALAIGLKKFPLPSTL